MNLHLTFASSLSLLSTLLLVAPAFADDATAPVPVPTMVVPPVYAPYSQQAPILETHRASPALIVTGAVTTFVGFGATVGGTLAYVFESGIVCSGGGDSACPNSGTAGLAIMIGGSVALLGGVTMIVFGARKVTTPLPEASLQLRPTGANLRITF